MLEAYNVTGLAASVALATTTSGTTTETGTASSGSSGAGRGNVTLLSTGVTRLGLRSGALVVSSCDHKMWWKLTSRDK